MRTLGLVALVVLLLAVTAVTSPWVAAALEAAGHTFKFSRVWNRVFQVLLVIGVIVCWRRLDLGTLEQFGFTRSGWWRGLGLGLGIGFAGIAAGLLVCWLGGGLVPQIRFPSLGKTATKTLAGLAAAVLVGAGEEILFRGVLLRRLTADCGRTAGVVLTTGLYAVVHALRPGGSRTLHAGAGVERVLALFDPLADPTVVPAIVGLAGLGAILALARLRTGSLWLPIGIHASWVAVFRVGRLFFHVKQRPAWLVGPGWPPLVGGVAGMVALAVTFGLLLLVLRRAPRATTAPAACRA